jgi:hypothetical protein
MGSGWVSGVASVFFGMLGVGGVLALGDGGGDTGYSDEPKQTCQQRDNQERQRPA